MADPAFPAYRRSPQVLGELDHYTMNPQIFLQRALEQPLNVDTTFFGSGTNQLLLSSGIGTTIRENQLPPLALDTTNVNPPVSGAADARGYRSLDQTAVRPPTRVKTPEEVAASGDKLFQTEAEMKASPYYPEGVPFEPGMTENRLKAIGEQKKLQYVREFYGGKRPWVNFFGSMAGGISDPLNFIPIFGEAAGAAAVTRFGKIAGRAFIMGGDAGANQLIFQAATAEQRAALGDDTSWNAMLMNAAYAAMGGTILGGALGGAQRVMGGSRVDLSKFRHYSDPAEPPKVEAPAVPPAAGGGVEGAGPVPRETTAPHPATPVLSSLETAGQRIKASAVMNDALDGLANREEVQLGEGSQALVEDMARKAMDKKTELIDTRGGGERFHGSPSEIDRLGDAYTGASENNYYGAGFYTTDAVDIARGYATRRGAEAPKVYTVKEKAGADIKPFDMEQPVPAWLKEYIDAREGSFGDLLRESLDENPQSVRELYDNIRGNSPNHDIPKYEVQELFDDLAQEMEKQGFNALDHTGGLLTKKPAHAVRIYLKPDEQLDITPTDMAAHVKQQPAARLAEAARIVEEAPAGLDTPRNYSAAAPEPPPEGLPAASAAVEANVKVPANPEQAIIDKAVADAKAEGFDPETNTNDLELDVKAIREQRPDGKLTAGEENALKEADATYAAVTGWEDAMNAIRTCILGRS